MDTKNPSFPDPEEYYAFMDAPGPSPDPKFTDAAMESPRSNLAGAWLGFVLGMRIYVYMPCG
jgi:hypothetical protein